MKEIWQGTFFMYQYFQIQFLQIQKLLNFQSLVVEVETLYISVPYVWLYFSLYLNHTASSWEKQDISEIIEDLHKSGSFSHFTN